jgi:uncharacterized membrane protein YfcA
MELLGYCLAVFIGLSLGLIGSGGSILTMPVLVYLLGLSPVLATTYTLFIVGCTALVGVVSYARRKLINYPTALFFTLPSFVGVVVVRRYVMPMLPDQIATFSGGVLTKNLLIMLVFAVLMFTAAFLMVYRKGRNVQEQREVISIHYGFMVLQGLLVGCVTGFVAAGGGFLIIPALVLLAGLPMRLAVGTSLTIVATNSLVGFISDPTDMAAIDWSLLLSFTALAACGIFIGTYASRFISAAVLKRGFGYFLMVMACYIMFKELSR